MKNHFLLIVACFSIVLSFAQEKKHSVYLIGDAGEHTQPHEALLKLKKELTNDEKSSVLFLGDNVYPNGLDLNDSNSILRMNAQLNVLKAYIGQAYIIPGNHDWDAQKRKGNKILYDQQLYVDSFLRNQSTIVNKLSGSFYPKDGLPGPHSILLADKLRLIIIDTQWFLHVFKKNTIGSKKNTEKLFFEKLDSMLLHSKNNQEQVIIAGHHPLYTNGQHSKKMQPLRFMVNYVPPFQLFGLAGLYRLFSQDIDSRHYKQFRKNMFVLFDKYDHLIYVSGHDHNMQYFNKGNDKYIVSGSGSKLSSLQKKKRFESKWESDQSTGFIRLDFYSDGSMKINAVKPNESILIE